MRPILVGICGGSCSGKTTLARYLMECYPKSSEYLSQDSYYFDVPNTVEHNKLNHNFDSPDSFDLALFEEHLKRLKRGETIEVPIFNFPTHTRKNEGKVIGGKEIIFVDGLFLLTFDSIRTLFDYTIYLDVDEDERHRRRIAIYQGERGWSLERVETQYIRYVLPMHNFYIEPNKEKADSLFPCGGKDELVRETAKRTINELLKKK